MFMLYMNIPYICTLCVVKTAEQPQDGLPNWC